MTMFCHQCQETSMNKGCTMKQGVCGKTSEVANLQDLSIWVMKGISFFGDKLNKWGLYDEKTGFFIDKGLFMTITNADFSKEHFINYITQAIGIREGLKEKFMEEWRNREGTTYSLPLPEAASWKPATEDEIIAKAESGTGGWMEIPNEDIRALKSLVVYGLKGISAYAEHAYQAKHHSKEIFSFMMEGLNAMLDENLTAHQLVDLVMKTGEMGVKTMELLDTANTTGWGHPEVTQVNIGVRNNPGILISGHDLVDLEELLEQTKGTGVDVYTHSEMLGANAYPKLKKYDHLVGNYGNAWHLQREEFKKFHGPVLFTSNCIVPPTPEMKEKIFTSGACGFEGCTHIPDRPEGGHKDFSKIIEMAKKCNPPEEIENGTITIGFAHNQLSKVKDKVINAVKNGDIKRFVVMAGCDGRHKERNYYTEVANKLPEDTVILTAGCAKYRYNKLNLGDIGGIPRVIDAGQCNDSYSLAVTALELQKAFGLDDINKLPISFDIAWYEQKAVLVLLSLLALGVKGIRLGPTLPGFLTPNIAKVLIEKFDIKGITTPENDIAAMMNGN